MSTDLPAPRHVTVTVADVRSMTWIEAARSAALAGVKRKEWVTVIRAAADEDGDPEQGLRGVSLAYAWAYVLVKRAEPEATWEQAQSWAVTFDTASEPDDLAEAEAEARVEASIATGLPPDVAGNLTLAEMEHFAELSKARR